MTASGRATYAQAMALYQQGQLSPETLEHYRTASPRNDAPPLPQPATPIQTLLDQTDLYLTTLTGPGIAETRAGLNQHRHGPVTPHHSPIPHHLPAALAQLAPQYPDLAHAIAAAAPHLHWITYDGYGPDIGPFAQNHAYASILGETIPAPDFDLGLFLIAPHTLYRDHHHAAPELYAPLTGPHGWRFAPNRPLHIKQAHQPIWNPPNRPHLTKVGPTPFLALYAWTQNAQSPAYLIPAQDWPQLETLRLT